MLSLLKWLFVGLIPISLGLTPSYADAAKRSSRLPHDISALRIASRCDTWKQLAAVQIDGTHGGDGLDGTFEELLDTRSGRSVTRWESNNLSSADGYDGRMPWAQDFSAGTHVMNAPSALATAKTEAWMNVHGWCNANVSVHYRQRGSERSKSGQTLDVIDAKPAGGATITLFLDHTSHLIDRTVLQLDENHEVVSYLDWRTIDGVVVPFEITIAYPEDEKSEVRIVQSFRPRTRLLAKRFARPSSASNVSLPTGTTAVSVPYVLDGFKPIVEVKVNGKGPFPFVVDTGGHFILTAQTARYVGLNGVGTASSVNERKINHVSFAHVRRLEIGTAIIRNEVAEINPYGFAKLERGPRPPKAGWLGLELFENFAVTFDPTTRMMTLRPLTEPRPIPAGKKIPLVFDADAPLAACRIDAKPGVCMLDTGNAGSTIVPDTFARRNGLSRKLTKGIDVGGMRISRATVSIGSFKRRGALVSYASANMADAEPFHVEAAILSEELIDGFVSTFDYARKGVWLKPVTKYTPVRFNRSGVLAAKTPAGTFVVRDIIHGSSASTADLRRGDQILSVDGIPSARFSGADFTQANAAQRPTISYMILRGKALHRVTVALQDLLPM